MASVAAAAAATNPHGRSASRANSNSASHGNSNSNSRRTPSDNATAAAQVTFTNTRRLLFDTDGNQIDAVGAKINEFAGKYYLYGNSVSIKDAFYGIKSYSSVDLVNW